MKKIRQQAPLYILVFILLNYFWIIFWRGNEEMVMLGGIFKIIAPLIALSWLLHTFLHSSKGNRNFWFLLSAGCLTHLIGQGICIYYEIFLQMTPPFPNSADFIWLPGYIIYLLAFLFRLYNLKSLILPITFFIDIGTVIVVAISLSWNFIIQPMLSFLHSHNLSFVLIYIGYPIGSLLLLFCVLSLFLIYDEDFPQKASISLILGFIIMFIANTAYAYLVVHNSYTAGSLSDPLWSLSILFIGLSGIYAKLPSKQPSKHIIQKKYRNFLPYWAVSTLLVFTILKHYRIMEALTFGLVVTIVLLIIRIILTTIKNGNLLLKQERLTEDLLEKITEQKRTAEKIQFLAYHDDLTGLPNRNLFYDRLKKEMDRAKQHHHKVSVMFIDLDRFKFVNDTLGHQIGDILLQSVSKRLKECIQEKGIVCRIGGDEFTVILPSVSHYDSEWMAMKIIGCLGKPFSIENHELSITPSIGISLFPDHGEMEEDLIKKADMAMYNAKVRGKNDYFVYSFELDRINARKIKLENALSKAIGNHEFSLQYQPKVELVSGKMIGMEALIRWEHPSIGSVSPLEFVPLAEESGLIKQIGEWVLKTACNQMKDWQKIGLPPIPISVNVSARQLTRNFITTVAQVLQDTQLDPKYLELEITESVMQNIKESSLLLNELKGLGIQISIDDFGTGYSSLSYLKHLPIDSVKIDRSFINDILEHSNGGIMVKTIIDMGRNLNFNIIAEGIENEQQKAFLLQNNCFIGQGYFFSPPLPADGMLTLLKDQFNI